MNSRLGLLLLAAAAFVGGLIWYIQTPPSDASANSAIAPNVTVDGPLAANPPSKNTSAAGLRASQKSVQDAAEADDSAVSNPPADALPASASQTVAGQASSPAIAASQTGATSGASAKGLHFVQSPDGMMDMLAARMPIVNKGRPGLPVDNFTVEQLLPVYSASINRSINGTTIEDTVTSTDPNQFVCLLDVNGQPVQAVSVHSSANTGELTASFSPDNAALISAGLKRLAASPQINEGSYETCFLLIGGRGVNGYALWLKSDAEGGDLVYFVTQVATSQLPINPGTLLSAPNFFGIMRTEAQKEADAAAARTGRGRSPGAAVGQQ